MRQNDFSFAKYWWLSRLVLGALCMCVAASLSALAAPQGESEIPPDATPQVQQITPNQAAPGAHVKVVIQGSNFSAGAYVSSVTAAIHVESSKRISATQLEVQLSVSVSAQPSTVSLLVSNPASRSAETAFKIVAGEAPAAPPKENVEPSTPGAPAAPPASPAPAAPAAPSAPAAPAAPAAPEAPAAPSAPAAPATPAAPEAPAAPSAPAAPALVGPEVTTVEPPSAGPGFDMDLKITGKNFVQGAKVSFANPGVHVVGVTFVSSTELTAHIKVMHDAATGAGSLFVVNPDQSEVEAPFEVSGKGTPPPLPPLSPASTPTPGAPASPASAVSTNTQRYDAFHLGNPTEIFKVHGKVKGSLVVSPQAIEYQEDGKTLVSIQVSEIKEISTSSFPNNLFHITLNSGTTYHFAPGSLRPSDARNLVDNLRKVLPH